MLATIGDSEANVLKDLRGALEILHQDHHVIDTLSHDPPPPQRSQEYIRGTPTDYHEWPMDARTAGKVLARCFWLDMPSYDW